MSPEQQWRSYDAAPRRAPMDTHGFCLAAPLRLSSEPADCWDQIAKFGRFVKDDGIATS